VRVNQLTPELAALYNQLLGDREDIADAKEKLQRAEASYWVTRQRIQKILDPNTQTVAERVAQAIARIGKQPPKEYRAPKQTEREAEELHQLEQARKLK
jgi:hypothetical protein